MRRWVFNIIAAVSLLLSVACVATWFYSCGDDLGSFWERDSGTSRAIFVFRGRLFYQAYWISERAEGVSYESDSDPEPWHWDDRDPGNIYRLQASLKRNWIAGFGYDDYSYRYEQGSISFGYLGKAHDRTYWAPLWSLIAAFAILPLIVVRRVWRHFRRPGSGLCPTCRYNLTGNTSGICPECGTPVVGKAAAKA